MQDVFLFIRDFFSNLNEDFMHATVPLALTFLGYLSFYGHPPPWNTLLRSENWKSSECSIWQCWRTRSGWTWRSASTFARSARSTTGSSTSRCRCTSAWRGWRAGSGSTRPPPPGTRPSQDRKMWVFNWIEKLTTWKLIYSNIALQIQLGKYEGQILACHEKRKRWNTARVRMQFRDMHRSPGISLWKP